MFGVYVAAAFVSALAVNAAPSVSLKVSAPSNIVDVDNLSVHATITNTGDETLKLLKDPRSALNTFDAHTFNVAGANGASPLFKGARLRYSPEAAAKANKASEWTILDVGKSVVVEHDLSLSYNFTLAGAGQYTFSPASTTFYHMNADGSLATIEASTDAHATAHVSGQLVSSKTRKRLSKRTTYSGCSTSQKTGVNNGVTAGQGLVANSLTYLNAHTTGGTRYTYWFGTYSSSRFSRVKTTFTNLNNKFSTWWYDCTCTESGTYAYTYPSEYGDVYLCTLFFNVPDGGPDSKADTLVHEGTHFTAVSGTDDVVYGQSGSHSLAGSNPASAVNNADNYAYFSSNPTGITT